MAEAVARETKASEIEHYGPDTARRWTAEPQDLIFIGAMGICVRLIAPAVRDKHTDPAVVCVDSAGRFAVSVMSGHLGGANELTRCVARIIGARPVITTQSDGEGLWPLDTLARRNGWQQATNAPMNRIIAHYVGGRPTCLRSEVRTEGADEMERTTAPHVYKYNNVYDTAGPLDDEHAAPNVHVIDESSTSSRQNAGDAAMEGLTISVTYRPISGGGLQLAYYPPVLHLGLGCARDCPVGDIPQQIEDILHGHGLSGLAVGTIDTIEQKQDEPLLHALAARWPWAKVRLHRAEELHDITVPNPSDYAMKYVGTPSVSEAAALTYGPLLMEKQKGAGFTVAVSISLEALPGGHIEIVGAGPGDPELVSVRGKRFLEQADLILYAGSLVPERLTHYAKPGATVHSSATMSLEEQFRLMKDFYDRGQLIVRLHTGDPCIYGAIQEQMALFDEHGMRYHITPGISAFQAAAAALHSQFTIPERVQTIILTRGEGRTPMPEREQLYRLAQSRSTMCIYLSAAIAERVQSELLQAYPPETPVAVCYKLTWPEEKIFRGRLSELARLVHENELTLTTLLVVGDAIDNRAGLSRLYDKTFTHLFRKSEEEGQTHVDDNGQAASEYSQATGKVGLGHAGPKAAQPADEIVQRGEAE
ncbi:MAG: precorrin-4 C(11)-methyltransferase [Bacteroidaceae bacterium]|nr:precorrin-4 C(11)-methyltransferase [Bacteroidaceae bacterium]